MQSRRQQDLKEDSSLPLVASAVCWQSLTCLEQLMYHSSSAPVLTGPSSLCVSALWPLHVSHVVLAPALVTSL